MNEEHLITQLREAAQATPFADANIARAMARGRRMRRRRHAAVGATSTLAVVGFATLVMSLGGGPGQPVVQGALPAATPPPAAKTVGKNGQDVDPAVDQMRARADADKANTAVLLKALGPDWQVDPGDAAAGNVAAPPGGAVVPKPGSSAATTLPTGYKASARMMVFNADGTPSLSLASLCKPFAEKGTVNAGCVDVPLPDGRVAYYAGPGPVGAAQAGGAGSSAMYYFARSDGSFVRVEFAVGSSAARVSAAQQQQAVDWMAKYKQALAGAVADNGVMPEPVGTGSTPTVAMITDHDRDLVQMQLALGSSWTLTDGKLGLEANWGEYKQLPTLPHGYWSAPADITTISRAAFDAACGAKSGATPCEKRTTKDGSEVFVRTWADRDAGSGEYTGESAAYFPRPDGSVLLADIELKSEQVEKVQDTDQVAGMSNWLKNLQTRLVKAVTDPEVKG